MNANGGLKSQALIIEFIVLFGILPLLFWFKPVHISPLPALWLLTGYCYWQLRRDTSFDTAYLWKASSLAAYIQPILITFAVVATVIMTIVWRLIPGRLFVLLRTHPLFWAVIMCLYPVLSVYPQSLIYRAFLFQRYGRLIKNPWLLILTSAVSFSFIHIIFRNPIAPLLTLCGGLLFAYRYHQTRSLFVSAFEHALYGCLMFTVGIGAYFYHGATLSR